MVTDRASSICTGCFENYLIARDTDNESFSRINDALDWLYFFDRLDGNLRTDRAYELLGYVPYSFVPWYPLFSSQTPNPVELPKTDYEVRRYFSSDGLLGHRLMRVCFSADVSPTNRT